MDDFEKKYIKKSDPKTRWVNDLSGKPFIEMIFIPEGTFVMGMNESTYEDEKPEREVYLSGYWIAKYPTTNAQFYRFIQETGYNVDDTSFLSHWIVQEDGTKVPPEELLQHPVVYVNWEDSMAFCIAYGLTLPSEAQWEKAARGDDKRTYPWGNEDPDVTKPPCNFRNLFGGTTPVGIFDGTRENYNGISIASGESPYGVQDMAGNVWEWCADQWDPKWLLHMGEHAVNPCNSGTIKKPGVSLEQIQEVCSKLYEKSEEQIDTSLEKNLEKNEK